MATFDVATTEDMRRIEEKLDQQASMILRLEAQIRGKPRGDENKMISTKEAAERMGLSEGYLKKVRDANNPKFPKPERVGRLWKYWILDVQEWCKKRGGIA